MTRREGGKSKKREGKKKKDPGVRRTVSENVSLPFFAKARGDGSSSSSLPNLHIVGWEKAVSTSAHASPPALVDHLNVGDDVVGVKRNFVVAR